MSACPAIAVGGDGGVADALRAVDCLSGVATRTAFGRLFGTVGALGIALTLALTLYVALLAIGLLTGRSRIGLSTLTPRAFALGLALTFATSWMAYQSVVWNLAVGAPDEIAGIVVGSRGSATAAFAARLDDAFAAVSDAAETAQAAQTDATPKAAGLSPADVLWFGAMLLLLGTVGILVTTRIALAALLVLGPVFVVFSLFRGTRGLFEGWLKGVALFAMVPMFAVLIGGGALAFLSPVIASLAGSEVDMRAAVTVLLAAVVYCALMAIVIRVCTTVTSTWRIPGGGERGEGRSRTASTTTCPSAASGRMHALVPLARADGDDRVRRIVASAGATTASGVDHPYAATGDAVAARTRPIAAAAAVAPIMPTPASADGRARGIGSQFRITNTARETLPC